MRSKHAGITCRFSALLVLLVVVACGCSTMWRGAEVVDNSEYARLIRLFPRLMQSRGLADEKLTYHDFGRPDDSFGEAMFRQLSPDFIFQETAHHVYFGENFHATLTPSSRVFPDGDGQGFAIVHPTQRLAMRMLAVVDWNNNRSEDWLMRCTVESFRGNRVRHYYVLAPAPQGREQTHGMIMAVVTEQGFARPLLELRDISSYGKSDDMPPTEVEDSLPGEKPVTTPPEKGSSTGGVVERDI